MAAFLHSASATSISVQNAFSTKSSMCSQSSKKGFGFFDGAVMGSADRRVFFHGERTLNVSVGSEKLVSFEINADAASGIQIHTLAPAPGSRHRKTRKGRGIAAGQGASCGFGMRGQNSRSGRGTRPGFEGGQTPLYRRVPKLRGVAGGMPKGVKEFSEINVGKLNALEANSVVDLESLETEFLSILRIKPDGGKLNALEANSVVDLESLETEFLSILRIKPDGRPLKILGDGELSVPLTVRARAATESAKQKIESAGGKLEIIPGPKKWLREPKKMADASS
eukprot:CAMPEP_0196666372 /NCGR_PEP_ID=MMETSP1086-20130531/64476_1 /TAXON_ID=77921 /ORGANISM="Cyanoptyche  gloeocystis , Strain SAG4.97" /LENGTH=281 /DNA_ID=CAMNT_0042003555 /DNA_START=62 /DNA_END=906 /DNA_ORIENTATION=-